jgi:DNA modification methylase
LPVWRVNRCNAASRPRHTGKWGLRDYGIEEQVGLELTPDLYVEKLVTIFSEVKRILRTDGCFWLNLGDSYAGGGRAGKNPEYQKRHTMFGKVASHIETFGVPMPVPVGLKPKDLVGIPWRVALALQKDGWWLRSDCIWQKNCMPESVTDRPTKSHEYVFLLAKNESYFSDAEAVKEPSVNAGKTITLGDKSFSRGQAAGIGKEPSGNALKDEYIVPENRNLRTVWSITTDSFPGEHYAVFPKKLVERCVLSGTSEKGCCPQCGAPWERIVDRQRTLDGDPVDYIPPMKNNDKAAPNSEQGVGHSRCGSTVNTLGWQPTCECGQQETVPCTVLDPFCGAGTTGLVALRHGRNFVGIELNPKYVEMAKKIIIDDSPMFNYAAMEK